MRKDMFQGVGDPSTNFNRKRMAEILNVYEADVQATPAASTTPAPTGAPAQPAAPTTPQIDIAAKAKALMGSLTQVGNIPGITIADAGAIIAQATALAMEQLKSRLK